MTCDICAYAREHAAWPPDHRGTHCGLDHRGPDHDCHRSWTGMAQSHCSECHRHFGSDSAGDAHRARSDTNPRGECSDPVGFPRYETPTGTIWGGRDPAEMAAMRQKAMRAPHHSAETDETEEAA
jgi:hypothetical protein